MWSKIASLPFPAKIFEKLLNSQLALYIEDNNLLDETQFGFRKGHGTETALIKASDEIRTVLDQGGAAVLVLLDLSAAFDTVDHATLIDRVLTIGIKHRAKVLLASFLSNRTQLVSLGDFMSSPFALPCGVPQGSSLSPPLFNIYVSDLARVIKTHGMGVTSYADETQLVLAIHNDGGAIAAIFQDGMLAISTWMANNCLKLNSDNTEVLIFGNLFPAWSPTWWPANLGPPQPPVSKVKNLGVLFDGKLSFSFQANAVVSSSFYTLRMIKKLLPFVPPSAGKTLIGTLVMSKNDYCNGLHLNAQKVINRLQMVQNSAARMLTSTNQFQR